MGYDRIVYIRYHFSCGLDRKDACWLSFTPLTGLSYGRIHGKTVYLPTFTININHPCRKMYQSHGSYGIYECHTNLLVFTTMSKKLRNVYGPAFQMLRKWRLSCCFLCCFMQWKLDRGNWFPGGLPWRQARLVSWCRDSQGEIFRVRASHLHMP